MEKMTTRSIKSGYMTNGKAMSRLLWQRENFRGGWRGGKGEEGLWERLKGRANEEGREWHSRK